MPEENLDSEQNESVDYKELLSEIERNPYADEIWEKTVALARREEQVGQVPESFYSHVPLEELVIFGEKLRQVYIPDGKYRLLLERCSTGELWYDIILGHVNDKVGLAIDKQLDREVRDRGGAFNHGLDVGTGSGNTLRSLARYCSKVTGIDRFEFALGQAKRVLPDNAELVVGDATILPFRDNTFDLAASNGLTGYLSRAQTRQYIDELSRVLSADSIYYEAFVTKWGAGSLPLVELEYLTSAKAMLVCLLDRVASDRSNTGGQDGGLKLHEIYSRFNKNGFHFYNLHDYGGVEVAEFRREQPRVYGREVGFRGYRKREVVEFEGTQEANHALDTIMDLARDINVEKKGGASEEWRLVHKELPGHVSIGIDSIVFNFGITQEGFPQVSLSINKDKSGNYRVGVSDMQSTRDVILRDKTTSVKMGMHSEFYIINGQIFGPVLGRPDKYGINIEKRFFETNLYRTDYYERDDREREFHQEDFNRIRGILQDLEGSLREQ